MTLLGAVVMLLVLERRRGEEEGREGAKHEASRVAMRPMRRDAIFMVSF